jgi:chromosome segregation ATPase
MSNHQIIARAQHADSDDEDVDDSRNASMDDSISSRVTRLSRRQGQLVELQVQTIQHAKGFIEQRVSLAESEARSYAEALNFALTQVQVDQHVLKDHLSVYLQGISETARQHINSVHQDLQSRHATSLQSYDQRVAKLDMETRSNKDALRASEQAIHRIDGNQVRIDVLEQALRQAQATIERQARQIAAHQQFDQRIDRLEEKLLGLSSIEARMLERTDKLIATAQLATATTITRLTGRMDRYDARAERTTARLSPLVQDVKKQLQDTMTREVASLKEYVSETDARLQTSTRTVVDSKGGSLSETLAAQIRDLLALETSVAQIAASRTHDSLPSKVVEHSEQIREIRHKLDTIESEGPLINGALQEKWQEIRVMKAAIEEQCRMYHHMDDALADKTTMIHALKTAQEQHHALLQQLVRASLSTPQPE